MKGEEEQEDGVVKNQHIGGPNKKSLSLSGKGFLYSEQNVFLHFVDLQCQLRLQVRCLILVNNVFLGQFVDHGYHFRILLDSLFLAGFRTEILDGIPCGFGAVAVIQPSGFRLLRSFYG